MLHQSALHLAVWRPHHLKLLLDGSLEINQQDWAGRTPLMYAAAAGITEVAISLVKAGADLWVEDNLYGSHDFIHYAVRSTHWDLAIEVLDFVRQSPTFSSDELRSLLNTAIILWAGERSERRKSEHFDSLLTWGADPDIKFTFGWEWHYEESNTLLHSISTLRDFDSLVTAGFKSFNHENSTGAHPLMKLVQSNDPQLVQKCIDSGSFVHHQDHFGHTALHVCAEALRDSFLSHVTERWDLSFKIFESAEVLLRHGSDPFLGDRCRCACSTMGCTPTHILLKEYRKFWTTGYHNLPRSQYYMSLEWLDLIRKVNGLASAKQCVLDMLRQVRFEELGLTHTCCRKASSEWKGLWTNLDEDEVDEIMDEEKEIAEDLESQMCEIEMDIQSGSDLDTLFLSEVTKLIAIRNERQRGLFLASQANIDVNVSYSQE
jgi:ankyrin repeat protein